VTVADLIALLDGGSFRRLGDVLDLAAVETEPTLALPAAFVLRDQATAQDAAQGTQIFEQLVTTLFGVLVVVSADGARRGVAQASLETLEAEVLERLYAATLPGVERPLAFVDSRLVGLGAGRVSRLIRFRAVRRLRVVKQP
jgi:hypothetical protein